MWNLDRWGFKKDAPFEGRDAEQGQGLAEYTLILTLIALVCIVALTLLGQNIAAFLTNLAAMIVP